MSIIGTEYDTIDLNEFWTNWMKRMIQSPIGLNRINP